MENYSANLWHPMIHPNEVKQREAVHIVSADGVYLKDAKGRELLDGNAGGLWCVNVGHNNRKIKEAINRQIEELTFYQIFDGISHPRATELAKKLIEITQQEGMKRVFFTSGGSDSNETALKLARQYHLLNGQPERKKMISLKGAYHGSHFGASTMSGMSLLHRAYEPLVPGGLSVEMPALYRNPWQCDDPEALVELCIAQLIAEIEYQVPETIAAIIAEPVNGANLIIPPASYWPRLREVCDRYGILLIADEVITGFGRSGCLFGSRGWGVAPDMMCLAKGISSGYIPLGAVMINERMEQAWDANDDDRGIIVTGVTYAGHPLACAAALAAIDIVEQEDLANNARVQGDYLLEQLKPFASKYPSVGDVRGKGLMIALDLVESKVSREPVDPARDFPYQVAAAARRNGLMIRCYGNKIMASPSLIYTRQHCDQLVTALGQAFDEVDN